MIDSKIRSFDLLGSDWEVKRSATRYCNLQGDLIRLRDVLAKDLLVDGSQVRLDGVRSKWGTVSVKGDRVEASEVTLVDTQGFDLGGDVTIRKFVAGAGNACGWAERFLEVAARTWIENVASLALCTHRVVLGEGASVALDGQGRWWEQ